MSGTKRQYAAYADATECAGPQEVITEHSGKYDLAGLIVQQDGTWAAVKFGTSWESVGNRTRTYFRRTRSNFDAYYISQLTQVSRLWEVTAPIVRDYFGSHRVVIAKGFLPGKGWVDFTSGDYGRKAGKSRIRALAREGYTALGFAQGGRGPADFEMSELLKSMNLRKKAS